MVKPRRTTMRDAIINSHIDPAGIAAVGIPGGAHMGVLNRRERRTTSTGHLCGAISKSIDEATKFREQSQPPNPGSSR